MKCKACNGTLSCGEQTFDNRIGELNDMCNVCIDAGLLQHEFDFIKCAIDYSEIEKANETEVITGGKTDQEL